ncbi:MAG: Trehalose-6-phosphate phosphatase [uncultured Nocardioidaceae bacterium]|uniref:Trehalose 6-phosphate phosphatase n=1 Tax=uncultured Nocardioidaceae bacterium TaxID=253824 RepID=A0A6J4M764_9ACTN|nr:MAG: Trehalose-6-phosphate phosphatase [uncultured Nocardioidaceae bacterium]
MPSPSPDQPLEFRTPEGGQRYADLVAAGRGAVLCLDFDGVLAPIVDDPSAAWIHPGAPEVLVRLAAGYRAVAVVTGRPAGQAVELGGLDALGRRVRAAGGDLLVLGQYGHERWSAADGRVHTPAPPEGLAALADELPALLGRAGAEDARVERKSLAVAVHTRRLADPQGALDRLRPLLDEAAQRHGLVLEPGRAVLEVRAPGVHKGRAVRTLHEELDATAMLYAGDDLGDIEAFEALAALREEQGLVALLVCSGSEEQQALVDRADLVVPGPDGVVALLERLAGDAGL